MTVPAGRPSWPTADPSRGGWRPSVVSPTSRRATPRSRSAIRAARPRNVGLSQPTTQPSPACSGVMPGPSSWPCRGKAGLEAQGVAGPEAGRLDAGAEQGRPQGVGGVGRARHTRRRPRRCSRCPRPRRARPPTRTGTTPKRGTAAASGATVASRVRAWGPCTAMMHAGRVVSSPPMASSHPVGVRGVGHHVEHLVGQPPDDDVVDHRAVGSSRRWVYWARPGPDPAQVVGQCGLQPIEGAGALDPHRAQMADVEDHRSRGGRPGARPGCPRRRRAASPSRRTRPAWPPAAGGRRSARCAGAVRRWPQATDRRAPSGCRPRRRGYRRHVFRRCGRYRHAGPLSPARPYLARRARVSRWYRRLTRTSGIELAQPADLAVLLGHQPLVEGGHLDEEPGLGKPEVGPEAGRRATVLVPVERELDRLVLPQDAVEVEDPREPPLGLVGEPGHRRAAGSTPDRASGSTLGSLGRRQVVGRRMAPGRGPVSAPRCPAVDARRWPPRARRPRRTGAGC